MKIGIVSSYSWLKLWDNYGTLLQNYALQTFLKERGHTTFWIRTRPSPPTGTRLHQMWASSPAYLRFLIRLFLTPLLGRSRSRRLADFNERNPRHFLEFMTRHVPTTSRELTIEELIREPPIVDALVVGSDQVWTDVTRLNFLDFGSPHLRRVAYAVGAPWAALNADWIRNAAQLTSPFAAVSVRELEGLEVCRKLGRDDAVHVVDPVLLLEASDYLDVVRQDGEDCLFPAPFVLGYFVNVKRKYHIPWEGTVGFARARGVDLRVVPLQGAELVIPEEYVFTPSPAGWMNAIHKADCLLTNSYHGTLFAIIMKKPFLVFLQDGPTSFENCRFTSALQPLGLDDRVISAATWTDVMPSTLDNLMSRPIDWSSVAIKLSQWRRFSAEFLDKALELSPPCPTSRC